MNALDNRKTNLRVATKSENAQNYKTARSDSKTGILGVCWSNHHNKWQASIQVCGKGYRSYCETIEEAEEAVKELRRVHMPFSKEAREEV